MRERAARSSAYGEELRRVEPFVNIAHRVMTRREELGLTQRQLAERMGTSHSAISRIESGQHLTSVRTLQRLAGALQLELAIDLRESRVRTRRQRRAAA